MIIADCPPSIDSPITLSTLVVADLALVPTIPAPADLWATSRLVGVVEQARALNPSLEVRLVPNMVQGTALAAAALEALSEIPIQLARSSIALRTAYRQAQAEGATVLGLRGRARRRGGGGAGGRGARAARARRAGDPGAPRRRAGREAEGPGRGGDREGARHGARQPAGEGGVSRRPGGAAGADEEGGQEGGQEAAVTKKAITKAVTKKAVTKPVTKTTSAKAKRRTR